MVDVVVVMDAIGATPGSVTSPRAGPLPWIQLTPHFTPGVGSVPERGTTARASTGCTSTEKPSPT